MDVTRDPQSLIGISSLSTYGLCLRATAALLEIVYELCTLQSAQAGSIVFHGQRQTIYCQLLNGHVFTHAILVKHLQFGFRFASLAQLFLAAVCMTISLGFWIELLN